METYLLSIRIPRNVKESKLKISSFPKRNIIGSQIPWTTDKQFYYMSFITIYYALIMLKHKIYKAFLLFYIFRQKLETWGPNYLQRMYHFLMQI